MKSRVHLAFGLLPALAWFSLYAAAQAECVPSPSLSSISAVDEYVLAETTNDTRGRVVAPVMVNGEGPFRFIVDTGANRSVLSERLAERLGLQSSTTATVHTIQGPTIAPIVSVNSMSYHALGLPTGELPLLGGGVLAGEDGLLGTDGLRDRRLRLDFDRECIEIIPSHEARPLAGWSRLQGELRFGQLVVIKGEVSGIEVNVLIDTGSDFSLANSAFHEATRARSRPIEDVDGITRAMTGSLPIVLNNAVIVPRLELAGVNINNLVAFVGDYHVFSLYDFENEPTLLVGMDVLSRTRAIAIDYGRATVQFQLGRRTQAEDGRVILRIR